MGHTREHDLLALNVVFGLLKLRNICRVNEHMHESGFFVPADLKCLDVKISFHIVLLPFIFKPNRNVRVSASLDLHAIGFMN